MDIHFPCSFYSSGMIHTTAEQSYCVQPTKKSSERDFSYLVSSPMLHLSSSPSHQNLQRQVLSWVLPGGEERERWDKIYWWKLCLKYFSLLGLPAIISYVYCESLMTINTKKVKEYLLNLKLFYKQLIECHSWFYIWHSLKLTQTNN